MSSEKSKTNKKWTSTDKYREEYEKIFGKKPETQGGQVIVYIDDKGEEKIVIKPVKPKDDEK